MPFAIRGFLNGQPAAQQQAFHGIEKGAVNDYFSCLNDFWNGHAAAALNRASSLLAQTEDHPMRFPLYRLWIEILAHNNETPGLHALLDHLLLRGQADREDQSVYLALRGLVHLELDQPNAASLVERALRTEDGRTEGPSGPYVFEFSLRQALRSAGESTPAVDNALAHAFQGPICDYFVWESISVACQGTDNAATSVSQVTRRVSAIFPGAPLESFNAAHMCIQAERFADAFIHASALTKHHPENSDFVFLKALAKFKSGEFETATEILQHSSKMFDANDPDYKLLLAQCLVKTARLVEPGNQAAALGRRAEELLNETVRAQKRNGLPTTAAMTMLGELEEQFDDYRDSREEQNEGQVQRDNDHSSYFRPTKIWFSRLNQVRFHELRSSTDQNVERISRPMGEAPRPGDLCFLAAEFPAWDSKNSNKEEKRWHIGAIYTVISAPAFHPVHRFECALQLVSRPEVAIPVDIEILDRDQKLPADLPRHHPIRYGVFELEEGALDVITEAVKQRSHIGAAAIQEHWAEHGQGRKLS